MKCSAVEISLRVKRKCIMMAINIMGYGLMLILNPKEVGESSCGAQ